MSALRASDYSSRSRLEDLGSVNHNDHELARTVPTISANPAPSYGHSELEQKVSDNSGSTNSSWHSAIATDHEGEVNDPFLKQLQTILREEQDMNRSIFGKIRSTNGQSREKKLQHVKPAQSEEVVHLKKQLDDSYQRIADLEARVNDLTHLQSLELPDSLDEVLSQEKQKTEYMKLKELKKKAERQFTEARQTTQRMVAENCKLKEELLQEQHGNELRSQQIRALTREKEAQKTFKEKLEMWKSLPSIELKQATGNPKLTLETGYPDIAVTPELLWSVIYDDPATLTTGHVVIAGLPYCYKTTLVKRMLSRDGSPPTFSGNQRHLQMFEAVVNEDPLTKEKVWQSVEGIKCAVMYIAAALVRRCYELKRSPVFPKDLPTRIEEMVSPKIRDPKIRNHFWDIYQAVKGYVEKAKKDNTIVDLALSRHIMVNIWDLGVNRALYDIFPSMACYSDSIVVIDVCDLERDVPNLNRPPDLSKKDDYSAWKDDRSVLQVESRLYYLTLMAGVKQWYSSDTQGGMVPQAVLVGVHTKEFRERNDGKDLETALKRLSQRVSDQSTKLGITDTIESDVVAVCIDEEHGEAAEKEIKKFKEAIEKIMLAQSNIETSFPVSYMFLRSLFYKHESSHILKSEMAAVGRSCGILLEQSFHELLESCRNVGSVMFFPELAVSPASAHVILKVAEFVGQASKLYYLQRHVDQNEVVLNAEAERDFQQHYQYGIITECLAEAVFGREAVVFMDALFIGNLCSKIQLPEPRHGSPEPDSGSPEPPDYHYKDAYFFPSLRTFYNKDLVMESDQNALRIEPTMFLPLESLALFSRYLDSCFSDENLPKFKHCKEFNMICFEIKNPAAVQVKIVYFSKVAEIRIEGATTDNMVHSSFKSLFVQVFHHIRDYCPNIRYKMLLCCPNSTNDTAHYIEFDLICHDTTCYCNTCNSDVQFTGPRRLWLL